MSGCFDPLHEGHLALFEKAASYGQVLAAVAPDTEVSQKRTRFLPENTRRAVVASCLGPRGGAVVATYGVPAIVRTLQPTHYVLGGDWKDKLPKSTIEACFSAHTQVVYTDTRKDSSTRILEDYERRRSTEKLANLETFVRTQRKPKPWTPVTDYSWDARARIEGPHADILAELFKGCSVLDYGCGLGHLVQLLQERGMDAYGWDPQFQSTEVCGSKDLLICREVLEHVPAAKLIPVIRDLVFWSRRFVYVTTRFTQGSHLFDVDGRDDLDPTHCTMLHQDFLRSLFVLQGCKRRTDLEQRLDWMNKKRVLVYEVPHD